MGQRMRHARSIASGLLAAGSDAGRSAPCCGGKSPMAAIPQLGRQPPAHALDAGRRGCATVSAQGPRSGRRRVRPRSQLQPLEQAQSVGQLAITKRGPSLARFYLYFAALRLIARNPVIKRWYAIKTGRPGARKMKQVIELMRKLAKAFWHQANGRELDVERLVSLQAVADA